MLDVSEKRASIGLLTHAQKPRCLARARMCALTCTGLGAIKIFIFN